MKDEKKDSAIKLLNKLKHPLLLMVGCYGISTFIGYLMPNPFLYK